MGRPAGSTNKPKTSLDAHMEASGHVEGDPRDPNKDARPPRIRMQQSLKLAVPGYPFDWDNFYYRFFYDDPQRPGRIVNAEAAYYEHCVDAKGSKICRPSGGGTQYMMRLPQKYHVEDVEAKRQNNRRVRQEEVRIKKGEYAPTKSRAEGGESSIVDVTYTENPFA